MLLVLHKVVFIENKAAVLCVTMREHARGFVVHLFDIAFAITKFRVVGHFSNTFWHENDSFLKDSS